MNKVLYVFDFEKLDDFKLQFASRNFVSIALIFILAPTIDDIDDLDGDFIENCIIDITALALENGYYKLFIERYLYALIVSAKYCYATHELRLHQNDRCKRFTLV